MLQIIASDGINHIYMQVVGPGRLINSSRTSLAIAKIADQLLHIVEQLFKQLNTLSTRFQSLPTIANTCPGLSKSP